MSWPLQLACVMVCTSYIAQASCVTAQPLAEPVRAAGAVRSVACFSLAVKAGSAVRVIIAQPSDFEIQVEEQSRRDAFVIDAFEFGNETVTLTTPGAYQLNVKPVDPETVSSYSVSMNVNEVALHDAENWINAEAQSTVAKRSKTGEGVGRVISTWQTLKYDSAVARAHIRRGDLALARTDIGAAYSDYETARELCVRLHDIRCIAEASNNSGMVARRLGDPELSSTRLQEAARHWQTLSIPEYVGITLSNLGLLQWHTGAYRDALRTNGEALRLLKGRNDAAHGRVLNNLGLVYISLAEYDRAVAILDTAVIAHRKTVLKHQISIARGNLGWAYLKKGNLSAARSILETAVAEAVRDRNKLAQLPATMNLGEIYRRLGNYTKGRELLDKALSLALTLKDKQFEGLTRYQLGLLSRQEGSTAAAREMLLGALAVQRSSGDQDAESETLLSLAKLDYGTGNADTAREFAENAMRQLEAIRSKVSTPSLRASYYSRKRAVIDILMDLLMARQTSVDNEAGLLLAERTRSRALSDLLAEESLELAPKDLLEERARIQRQINFLSVTLRREDSAKVPSIRDRIHVLLTENDAVEARIRSSVQGGAMPEPLVSVSRLQESIPSDSALLEYHLGEGQSYLWMVTRNELRVFPLPARSIIGRRVTATAALFEKLLERRRSPDLQAEFQRSLRNLSQAVLAPLRGVALPERLVFALDAGLNEVPISALSQPGEGQPLGLKHSILVVPSGAFLTRNGTPRPPGSFPKTALVLADPVFSSSDPRVAPNGSGKESGLALPRLPFTADVDVLRSSISPSRIDVRQGFAANAYALSSRSLKEYGILHLSTHTIIDGQEPEMSHIALSMVNRKDSPVNGLVRPQHLTRWSLSRSLVVLSSCETALGKRVIGEGIVGFASSIFVAGASQIVMSTSKVDAEGSSEFFAHFYRSYLRKGATAEKSMKEARRAMVRSSRWADPYYWSAFTVIGHISRSAEPTR